MSKSLIYASNTQSQTGTTVNFGNVVRKYGCCVDLSGGNVILVSPGYYDVEVNLTLNNTTASAITPSYQIYVNGNAVMGAIVQQTIDANSYASVAIPCVIRNYNSIPDVVTVVGTGNATITNASVVAIKE